ncbi:BTAD domain-containing putative transcriptional regulator [Mycobacterium basiliense]|nr:BTAD domain-containing putative transcriptional regulator [Mycobacterium basiliense]
MVEFCLLGEVEVLVDGRRLELGHARQRCVLAALMVEANRTISVAQLIDRVWGDAPPFSARNSLTSYVSRLRNLVAGTQSASISRRSSGYVLTTDAASVDLHRFRHLVAQARAMLDPGESADVLDRALDMWKGQPLAFLDTPWVNNLRGSLVHERLAVQLDRNDIALKAGRHAELLAGLATTLGAHPLDERVAGQLMLAQYRSGRRAEALRTYWEMRKRLAEELGVDPGPELHQVHQRILAEEPGMQASEGASRGGSGPWIAPVGAESASSLLRRVTGFVGRAQELAQAADALRQAPLLTLAGVGGVGKTRLAFEVARRQQQQRVADNVWICELGPLDSADAVGHTVALALRLRQQPGLDIEESVIGYLRAREGLLVVDNCEHVLETAANLVQRIVRHCPGVCVLATSRQPLGIEGERIIVVPPMAVEDAARLFADRARASRPDFTLDDQPVGVVAEICWRVDCLPLGIELAAARTRAMSAADMLRRLNDSRLLRGGARGALVRHQSLNATIDWSYHLLTESEQAFFARLSVFAGSFDLDAAHEVCGADGVGDDETLELIASLVDKSMVTVLSVAGRTRYGILETLRAYARERLQEKGSDSRYASRHAMYFTELAELAGVGVHGPDERDWIERILPDNDNLRAAFEWAMLSGAIDVAMRLIASLPELIGVRVGYEVAGWAERLVAVADPGHRLFAEVVGVAARGAWNLGDSSRARHLVALAEDRLPRRDCARISYPADVLADAALAVGDASKASTYWAAEVDRARREDNPLRLVQAISALAGCQGVLGNTEAASPAALEAVAVADRMANPTAQSMAYFGLGFLLKKSEPERALELFDEAARLAWDVQNFWWYGIALMEAAGTRAVQGDPATAARMFIEVLDHWDRVGDWAEQWVCLRYVARLLARLGADEDALFVHSAVVAAGKPPPLRAELLQGLTARVGADGLAASPSGEVSGANAVARAASRLRRYAGPCHLDV